MSEGIGSCWLKCSRYINSAVIDTGLERRKRSRDERASVGGYSFGGAFQGLA